MGVSVQQTTHRLMSDALRDVLLAAVGSEPTAASAIGSIQSRACAVLYLLLRDHQVDRRGYCRSCRRLGAVFGQRRRRCRIHAAATHWLRYPAAFLVTQLDHELGLDHDHGGAGERLDRPLPRRAPLGDYLAPIKDRALLSIGGATRQSGSGGTPDGG